MKLFFRRIGPIGAVLVGVVVAAAMAKAGETAAEVHRQT